MIRTGSYTSDMNTAPVPAPEWVDVETYLDREAASDVKHEYVAGRIYAFAGATKPHNRLVSRLMRQLLNAAEDEQCMVYGSDMLLRAASEIFYYPDITVTCEPDDESDRYTRRPCLLVEVLSPTTMVTDLREKLVAYRNIASLEGYLIAYQDQPRIEWHARDEDGQWRHETLTDEGTIDLPCVEHILDVGELYSGMFSD